MKKAFQLALLCTKRQASDGPTMHEVARVLGSLTRQDNSRKQVPVPPPPTVASYMDDGYTNLERPNAVLASATLSSNSDANLFLKFGEVISHNTVTISNDMMITGE